jgi:hypothetical protein
MWYVYVVDILHCMCHVPVLLRSSYFIAVHRVSSIKKPRCAPYSAYGLWLMAGVRLRLQLGRLRLRLGWAPVLGIGTT